MRFSIVFVVLAVLVTMVDHAAAPGSGSARAEVQEKDGPPPAPEGVSPARPDIRPPDMEHWYCSQCGAANPFPKKHYKDPLHRPMLLPGARRPGAQTGQPGRMHKKSGRLGAELILRHAGELGLSEKQIGRLRELSFQTRKKLIGLRAKLQEERLELRRLIESDVDDRRVLKRQLNLVAEKRVDVQETRLLHRIEVKKILTADQLEQIKHKKYGFRGGDIPRADD